MATNDQEKWLVSSYMDIIGNSRKFDRTQDVPLGKEEDSLKALNKTKPNVHELLNTIGDTKRRQVELLEDSDILGPRKLNMK